MGPLEQRGLGWRGWQGCLLVKRQLHDEKKARMHSSKPRDKDRVRSDRKDWTKLYANEFSPLLYWHCNTQLWRRLDGEKGNSKAAVWDGRWDGDNNCEGGEWGSGQTTADQTQGEVRSHQAEWVGGWFKATDGHQLHRRMAFGLRVTVTQVRAGTGIDINLSMEEVGSGSAHGDGEFDLSMEEADSGSADGDSNIELYWHIEVN